MFLIFVSFNPEVYEIRILWRKEFEFFIWSWFETYPSLTGIQVQARFLAIKHYVKTYYTNIFGVGDKKICATSKFNFLQWLFDLRMIWFFSKNNQNLRQNEEFADNFLFADKWFSCQCRFNYLPKVIVLLFWDIMKKWVNKLGLSCAKLRQERERERKRFIFKQWCNWE